MNKEDKIMKVTEQHLNNIERLRKGKPSKKELEEMYSYLNNCIFCGKEFTFWDGITFNRVHGFSGNVHRRDCVVDEVNE